MKTSICFSLALVCTGIHSNSAHAQSIDVTAINERSAQSVPAALNAARAHQNQLLRTVGDGLASGLTPNFDSLKPARALTSIEIQQADLIDCVDHILTQNQGGYDAPMVAHEILRSAMNNNGLSNDPSVIVGVTQKCEELRPMLTSYRSKDIDSEIRSVKIAALPLTNAADKKSQNLIGKLVSKGIVKCIQSFAELRVGFTAAISTRSTKTKCVFENGKVRNYFGPGIAFDMGFGAVATASRVSFTNANAGKLFIAESHRESSDDWKSDVFATLGSANMNLDTGDLKTGLSVGAGIISRSGVSTAGVKIYNGKRRWDMLVDLLK